MIKKSISLVLVFALIFGISCVPSSAAFVIDDLGIVAIVSSLVLICGFTFADYQSTTSFASDLWNRIKALPDRFGDLISGLQSLVVDTYDTVSNVVSISGDLLNDFVEATEEVLDVSLYPVLQTPSVSFRNDFYFPVMIPYSLSGNPIYFLHQPLKLSNIQNGSNLLYTSDSASLYLYKSSSTYQVIGKIGDRFYRLSDVISPASTADSFVLFIYLLNSNNQFVSIDNWVNSGWSTSTSSKPALRSLIGFLNDSGGIANSYSYLDNPYFSTEISKIVGSSTSNLNRLSYVSVVSDFSSSYLGDHLHSVSFDNVVSDFHFSCVSTSKLSSSTFESSLIFPLFLISLSMGLEKGIGTYSPVNTDIPIFQNPPIMGSDDSLLDVLIPMTNIDIKFPSDVNSPDNVLPLNPVDLVVSEIDIPDNPPVDPDDPDDPLYPVIPDIDTSGILHYITDFFNSIADFFSFLFGLIGSFPSSFTFPIFGAFLILICVGLLVICL